MDHWGTVPRWLESWMRAYTDFSLIDTFKVCYFVVLMHGIFFFPLSFDKVPTTQHWSVNDNSIWLSVCIAHGQYVITGIIHRPKKYVKYAYILCAILLFWSEISIYSLENFLYSHTYILSVSNKRAITFDCV